MRIFHIVRRTDWETSPTNEPYRADSLDIEGFVHCSFAGQVAATARRHFAGEADLLVLEIDAARLDVPVAIEDTAGSGAKFPHIYGPVPRPAIASVRPITDFAGTGAASLDR